MVVKTHRGSVWVSIVPPFTWEAIMDPAKVDELIQMLGLAREDAKRMAAARGRPPRGDNGGHTFGIEPTSSDRAGMFRRRSRRYVEVDKVRRITVPSLSPVSRVFPSGENATECAELLRLVSGCPRGRGRSRS